MPLMNNPLLRRVVLMSLVVLFAGMTAVGCNTTEGAGEDIENLGEGIQDAAD